MANVIIRSLSKRFGNHSIIDNLSLEIGDGEFVTLLGPSGCGKTTLLRMIAGLESVDQGDIIVGGKKYNKLPAQKRRLAMVFQSYALFPHMSVQGNIGFGLKIKGIRSDEIKRKTVWAVDLLKLKGLEDRFPREISGGQRQRVALARALVLDPDVLLLDEPLSNLDAALREAATEELKRIHRSVGKTIIYVTHNQVEAMTMSERIALLNAGKLEQYDSPKALYDNPLTIFSAEFIGSPVINLMEAEIGESGNAIGVITPVGFLRLDRDREEFLAAQKGRSVIIGIRPQHVSYADHLVSRRSTDTPIEVVSELIENLGDRSLVVGRGAKNSVIRFVITREEEIQPDKKLSIFVDGRRIHLFDPETRLNICG